MKDRQTDQWNRTECQEINLHILSTDVQQGCQDYTISVRIISLTGSTGKIRYIQAKNDIEPLSYTIHKTKLKKGLKMNT